jgi:hypothetical protein
MTFAAPSKVAFVTFRYLPPSHICLPPRGHALPLPPLPASFPLPSPSNSLPTETTTARHYRFITASTGDPSTLLTTCPNPSQRHSEPLRQQAEWLPLVKNLQLMSNCHHEDDAQLCVRARAPRHGVTCGPIISSVAVGST